MVSTAAPILLLELEIVHEHGADAGGYASPPPQKARAAMVSELGRVAEHLSVAAIGAPAAA